MIEEELLNGVLELARLRRVTAAHFRPARTKDGWRTAVKGDGKGFPDLVLVGGWVKYRELKTDRGDLTREQRMWGDVLLAAGADWAVWRPRDLRSGLIAAELQALARRTPGVTACPG